MNIENHTIGKVAGQIYRTTQVFSKEIGLDICPGSWKLKDKKNGTLNLKMDRYRISKEERERLKHILTKSFTEQNLHFNIKVKANKVLSIKFFVQEVKDN